MTALSERIDLAARDQMHRDLEMLAGDAVVDRDELLVWLSEDEDGLARFVAKGVIKPNAAGKYPLKASIEAYCQFWEDLIAEQDRVGGLACASVAGEA